MRNEINPQVFFSSNMLAIIILNSKGEIESINNKSLELLSCGEKQLKGFPFLNLVLESDQEQVRRFFNSTSELKSKNTIEIQINGCSDKPVFIELEWMNSSSNNQEKYLGIINDISKQKDIEQEVEDLKDAKQEVFKKLEEEKELSELKSRFVTMASHEFRTPLAGVLSSIQLIKRYLVSEKGNWDKLGSKSKIETHFNKIEESVFNLNQILNDFLSLGKIEENKVISRYTWFNLPCFLENMCEEFKPLCKSGQKISFRHIGSKADIHLDKHILRNIVNNLISNAIKYSGADKTIQLISIVSEGNLTIKVQDDGIGIPITEHKNIFRRFFRAGNAENFEGTGLGLNIVKKYTELMNGEVNFESEENKGTTFFIKFPLIKK